MRVMAPGSRLPYLAGRHREPPTWPAPRRAVRRGGFDSRLPDIPRAGASRPRATSGPRPRPRGRRPAPRPPWRPTRPARRGDVPPSRVPRGRVCVVVGYDGRAARVPLVKPPPAPTAPRASSYAPSRGDVPTALGRHGTRRGRRRARRTTRGGRRRTRAV